MLGSLLTVLLLTQAVVSQSAPPTSDEIRDTLKRAVTLYYDARFNDSVQLLVELDAQLQKEPDHQPERIAAKLQLALAYVGLNRTDEAKTALRQLYALNNKYTLNPALYAPKIIALADAAKDETMKTHCEAVRADVVKSIETGDLRLIVDRIQAIKSDCPDLAGMDSVVVDVLYQRGTESAKKAQYSDAMRMFDAVLKLSPDHDLATQYIGIVNTRIQLETERLALQWQKNFTAREFAAATATYRELKTIGQPASTEAINKIDSEYRNSVTTRLQDSRKACERGDERSVTTIRAEIMQMLPDPSLGADILSAPMDCTKVCLPSVERLVMRRLETRVEPEIPRSAFTGVGGSGLKIRVKATITETGDVTVTSVDGTRPEINSAVQSAVEKWKFNPAFDQNGYPRCVETEIPIVLKP
jgi:tetratricopeptide (TPR) repeat protein